MPRLRSLALAFAASATLTFPFPASSSEYSCKPTEVTVWQNRVHVRCTQSVNDGSTAIWYWAVATSDAERANRFLSAGSTALVSGRTLYFSWTAGDTSGVAYGCLARDCRTPVSFALR
jgi:hypothetical protein